MTVDAAIRRSGSRCRNEKESTEPFNMCRHNFDIDVLVALS